MNRRTFLKGLMVAVITPTVLASKGRAVEDFDRWAKQIFTYNKYGKNFVLRMGVIPVDPLPEGYNPWSDEETARLNRGARNVHREMRTDYGLLNFLRR